MSSTFTMPLGPVHVALEEPVYFRLTVEGETVRHVELTSGHVHRGMEAMATQRNLIKNTTLTERVCSLCSNSHSFTYCMSVENVLGITIPERARYLRVLAEEIKRVASHLFNTAIQAHIIGFKSLFMHVMEVREMMQDVKETVYGNRMNLASNCIGGVKCDVERDMLDYILGMIAKVEPAVDEIREIYDTNSLVLARTKGLGLLPREDAVRLGVVGLINIQFAIKGDDIYILEVNPRASRTAPFVSKATGVPLPYLATQVMLGKSLDELDPWSMRKGGFTCVKEAVMPFQRFPGVDIILGPEMHSTGEVMGMGSNFGEAFLKSQLGAGQVLPQGGKIFLSVNDRDKPFLPEVAAMFAKLGFQLLATQGTANVLREHGLEVEEVRKVYEGRPNIVDLLINHEVDLVINTASGKHTARDSKAIRRAALTYKVPYCTTIAAARATATAIGSRRDETHVESLQEYYAREARG